MTVRAFSHGNCLVLECNFMDVVGSTDSSTFVGNTVGIDFVLLLGKEVVGQVCILVSISFSAFLVVRVRRCIYCLICTYLTHWDGYPRRRICSRWFCSCEVCLHWLIARYF